MALPRLFVLFVLLLAGCSQPHPTAIGKLPRAAIASAHPLATEAGMQTLAAGGNAFDAAISVAAVLAVVEPYSAGMGGGGFWLLRDAEGKSIFVDAREKAPFAASRDMYLDKKGEIRPNASVNGPLAAAIPGQAAAFAHIAEHYGRLPLEQTLAAAIRYAEEGFATDAHYQTLAQFRLSALQADKTSAAIFLDANQAPAPGFQVKQPALAQTLRLLAEQGHKGFYTGDVARNLIADVRAAGGIWQTADLNSYNVVEREPLVGEYQGYRITTAPPPSSGGIAILAMFNMLAQFDWMALPRAEQVHLLSEIMRRAYRDRAEFLGDPDYVPVPVERLTDKSYNQAQAAGISMDKATSSREMGKPLAMQEGFHTTHFSILDKDGNAVSATLSINLPFGSAFTSASTGVLLNNEMDDFSAKPGVPNAYGLVGNEANAIAPGKRPLSSMSPSFIENENSLAIIGTPGGSRIISMVWLGMLEYLQDKPVQDWVARPRFHHQYLPDMIQHEPDAFSATEMDNLMAKGHVLSDVGRRYGNMQAILVNKRNQQIQAASDPRGGGSARVQ